MNGWWLSSSTLLLVAAATFVIVSLAAALVYPAFRRLISGCHPATRSLSALVYASIAPGAAAMATALTANPGLSGVIVPSHCHGTNCGSHAPVIELDAIVNASFFSLSALAIAAGVWALVAALSKGRRRLRLLSAFGRRNDQYVVVDSEDLFAWCCGLLKPEIVVSRALVQRLSDRELAVVIAHEHAHADRQDNLRTAIAAWSSCLWPRRIRARMRQDLQNDAEEACDRIALAETDDPHALLGALRTTKGSAAHYGLAGHAAFGGSPAARLSAIAGSDTEFDGSARAWSGLAVLWVLQVVCAAVSSHWLLEWTSTLGGASETADASVPSLDRRD